jgi:hypothetical protein
LSQRFSEMRYYFHVREGAAFTEDIEGVELASNEEALEEAREAARQMVAEMVRNQEAIDGKTFEVTDGDGNLLMSIPFVSVIIID